MQQYPIFLVIFISSWMLLGCASSSSYQGSSRRIANPFQNNAKDLAQEKNALILRTKQGDKTLELLLPTSFDAAGTLVIPLELFKAEKSENAATLSEQPSKDYANRTPSVTDVELTKFYSLSAQQQDRLRNLESSLNLVPVENDSGALKNKSYLGGIDKIKQLYKDSRYEVALLETDTMLVSYPMDPKLHEMKGTLLEKLGKADLAERSWKRALEFDKDNNRLKNFLNKKNVSSNDPYSPLLDGKASR